MVPPGGMTFSPETAVYPVFPPMEEPGAATVDWTDTQVLTSGWLLSRTRTQFLTIHNAEQRARVEIKPHAGGGFEFSNGLPWDVEAVVVADEKGRLSMGCAIQANASDVLFTPVVKDLRGFVELLANYRPDFPDGFTSPIENPFASPRVRFYRMKTGSPSTSFETNLMERLVQDWSTDFPLKEGLAPRSYLAILRQNPGVETGVPQTSEQMGYHLLLGYF